MIERLITFVVLGFFVFVADFGSWWQSGGLMAWHSNFLIWSILIVACYLVTRNRRGEDR
ncbi:MAG: hypothetical protein ACI82A_003036 [Candidatus Azotimanducaceae bacterium]|jgi:hypothetical protein